MQKQIQRPDSDEIKTNIITKRGKWQIKLLKLKKLKLKKKLKSCVLCTSTSLNEVKHDDFQILRPFMIK